MKKILFPLLMIVFVAGGAVAGDFVKNLGGDPSDFAVDKTKKEATKHGKSQKKDGHEKTSKAKKGGHGEEASASGKTSYLKFDRQFVVPVMTRGKIDALVIMNLNLELDSNAPGNAYTLEPKLRDAITRELLGLSNDGVFGKDLTSAESYETLRRTLLLASKTVIPDGVRDILILDIARQEQ
jgi:hypothetical protein